MSYESLVVVGQERDARWAFELHIHVARNDGADAVERYGWQGIEMAEIVRDHPHEDIAIRIDAVLQERPRLTDSRGLRQV